MLVGVLQVSLAIERSQSLKDKRQVVKSILHRVRASFNVSASEVDGQDTWQSAGLAFSAVSTDGAHLQGLLQKVLNHLKRHPVARVVDHQIEIL